jgi:hypothetical protein
MFTGRLVKNSNNCPTCKIVDVVCFWGEMPKRKWKRPFVFIVSLSVLIGLTYWHFFSSDLEATETGAKVISVIVSLMFLLGLISSVFGCDKCVAKVCGRA